MLSNIALITATNAHLGQVRKYTNEPYINHPIRVSEWLATFHVGEQIEAAALCHDVIEDCDCAYEDLEAHVGVNVADIVLEVTNLNFVDGTPRHKKFWANLAKLMCASHQAQTLKCGDIYDNCKDVYELDPSYAVRYIAEKFILIRLFTRAQSNVLEATVNMLSDVYQRMTPEHRKSCLITIEQLEGLCPDEHLVVVNNARAEAIEYFGFLMRLGDAHGTTPTAV